MRKNLNQAAVDNAAWTVVEAAGDQYPWDVGYRIDFYKAVADHLNRLANYLEEDVDA